MNNYDTASAERLLKKLDSSGWIFPEFELNTDENNLILLGRGGFSVVYEMFYKERPDFRYALKVIGLERHVVSFQQFRDTVLLQNYLSEQSQNVARVIDARAISVSVDEEGNIVDVCDASGECWDEEGLHLQFVLMERLSDIISKDRFKHASMIKDGLSTEEEILDFAMQIGDALKVSHDNNVLHRDIKLENIFWNQADGCFVLGDFGIAKFVEGGNAETVVYTDGYGAPEIERRLGDHYNATADIYSFGIALYLLLNNLRFPGSDGYFVNQVQYDPTFIFPAPVNASERMTRIIRKMCSFYPEDRYQSMDEVLFDLAQMGNVAEQAEDFGCDELDFETETYKEDRTNIEERPESADSRSARKKRKKEIEADYTFTNVFYMMILTVLLTFMQRGLSTDGVYVTRWEFWILPITVLIEAILMRIKEFHIAFGVVSLAIGGFSIYSVGLTVQHCILVLALMLGMPTFAAASAVSVGCWMYIALTGKVAWTSVFYKYDLSWILIVIVLMMVYRLMRARISAGKISMKRAYAGVFIFDKIFLLIALVGIVFWAVGKFSLLEIPDIITRLHLVRTGLVAFVLYVISLWLDGSLSEDQEEIGDNIDDDKYLDE